jgi:hypothetical protein
METGTLLTGLALLACCAIPIYMINRKRKVHERQLRSALQKLADKHQGQISKITFGRNFACGFDALQNRLYFFREAEQGSVFEDLAMQDISNIQAIREHRTVQQGTSTTVVVDRAGIRLMLRHPQRHVDLDFYRSDKLDTLGDELVVANAWVEYLKGRQA